MSSSSRDALRYLGALATLVVGAVHIQQYADFIADVPTIGALFALNGLGAGVVAIMLATRHAPLGALAGIPLSASALVAVFISMTDKGLFDYTEPTFRAAVVIAIVAEIAAIVLLLAYLAVQRRPAPPPPQLDRADVTQRCRDEGNGALGAGRSWLSRQDGAPHGSTRHDDSAVGFRVTT